MSLNSLLKRLNLLENKDLYRTAEKKWRDLGLPQRTRESLEKIAPTAFFCINDEPFVLFFDAPGKEKEKLIQRQIWNFNRAPLAFVIDDTTITVFNALKLNKDNKSCLQILDELDINDSSGEIDKYSLWNLLSGKYWENNKNKFKNNTRVDWYLLKNIEETILLLEEKKLPGKIAKKIIGFLIFARYLVDRGVKLDEEFIVNRDVDAARQSLSVIIQKPQRLVDFYNYLKNAFNGDLFELAEADLLGIDSNHCKTLHLLFQGGDLLKSQKSLFNIYDFSIIPVELISNIYERFIGKDKQVKHKAFYTPPFLVDYTLEKTVNKHLNESGSSRCRVLDPACGSGIFLVEAFRQIVAKGKKQKNGNLTARELERLLIDNIYGIDKDEDAIDIAVFSLYITLLDYKEPKDIANYKFPYLKYRKDKPAAGNGLNFFQVDFLDWRNPIFDFIKDKQFDFIIGNPPWGSIKSKENKDFIEKCKKENIIISDFQVAQSFMLRVRDFTGKGKTGIALIVTSKILYNANAVHFRNYFLKNFEINEVFNFSPVGRLVFTSSICPGAVIFYQTGRSPKNEIKHISLLPNLYFRLFRSLVIEKSNIKIIDQDILREFDWLWKPLLYGNSLDYHFLKRLILSHKKFNTFLRDNDLQFGAGLKRANKNKSRENIADLMFLPPESVSSFINNYDLKRVRDKYPDLLFEDVGIVETYKAPHLIIKQGIGKDRPILTFLDFPCAFSNVVYGIAGKNGQKKLLKAIGALLSSDLTAYFLFMNSVEWGVDRGKVLKREFDNIPLVDLNEIYVDKLDENFVKITQKFEQLNREQRHLWEGEAHANSSLPPKENLDSETGNLAGEELAEINRIVNELYALSEMEKDLIDYAINISIPLFKNKPAPLRSPDSGQLEKYARVFVDYFRDWYKGPDEYFKVEIYRASYFTGMNFKIVAEVPEAPIEEPPIPAEISRVIELLGKSVSLEKITKDIFIQKDIKGFEADSFYVIKPNEYKSWHPATARIDLLEFVDAILKKDAQST
ncbi:MAG: N-6 DNA methylase [Candidatus Aminicenantes bacterium]|nr:N-6 DNA methylase [Candidatus Aminicenantes bacterium]